jgi:threonine/homoserine/homoserine lactone efflux protein
MHPLALLGIRAFPVFVVSSVLITLLPGPATMYIVGRSLSQGRRAGLLSVLAIGAGSLCHITAVAFGLSFLLAASRTAFVVLKTAGAAYLVFLGVRMLLDRSRLAAPDASPPARKGGSDRRIFLQGLATQLLNPKAALFFVAILPQFVTLSARHSALPFLVLGATFVAIDTLWFSFVATSSARLTEILRRSERSRRVVGAVAGTLYIGLGITLLRARARVTP